MNKFIYMLCCLFIGPIIYAQHDILGNIHQTDGTAIPSVTIELSGNTTNTTQNNSAGDYNFSNLDAGFNYTVTPSKTTNSGECVTVADMVDLSKHILGIQSLSGYDLIAADVNNSGTLTSFDMVQMRQLILGITSSFPNANSWTFFDASQVLDPTNPLSTSLQSSIDITNLSANTQADFIGIKKGNVTECTPLDAAYMQLSLGTAKGCQGDIIRVPVIVHNFIDVIGLQFSIAYDDALFQFSTTQNFANNTSIFSSNFNVNTAGQISFAWTDAAVQGITLSNGTTLFELEFQVLSNTNTISDFSFTHTPTPQEMVTAAGTRHHISTQNGFGIIDCNVGDCTGSQKIYLASNTSIVQSGQSITVDMKVDGFTDVTGMQFSIQFDPNELQYNSVSLGQLSGLTLNNFGVQDTGNGIITFAWFDSNTVGTTLANESTIFSLHFTALNGFTGDVAINFSDTPTNCSVYNNAIKPLIFDKCGLNLPTTLFPNHFITTIGDNGDAVCSSFFEDDGGASGLYDDHAAPMVTIYCPDKFANRIQLTFLDWDVASGDLFSIYDTGQPFLLNQDGSVQMDASGNPILQSNLPVPTNISNPSSGTGVSNAPGTGFALASCTNTSGCITVAWQPNGDNIKGTGWRYAPVCIDKTACLPGDCTGSNNIYMKALSSSVQAGSQISVDVKADGFLELLSMQFSIAFDATQIQYNSLSNLNQTMNLQAGNFSLQNTANGQLTMAWSDPTVLGLTLPNNTLLFTLNFTVANTATSDFSIGFSETPAPIEIVNEIGQELLFDKCGLDFTLTNSCGSLVCNDAPVINLRAVDCMADITLSEILESICPNETYILEVTHTASNTTKVGSNVVVVGTNHFGDNIVKVTDSQGQICSANLAIQDNLNNCINICDDENIIHANTIVAVGAYKAEQTITSEGTIAANTTVTYQAGTSITLLPGFQTQANSNFQAIIAPCTTTPFVGKDNATLSLVAPSTDDTPQIQLFPNPTQYETNLKLYLSKASHVQIRITDLTGQSINPPIQRQLEKGWHQNDIVTQQLPNGIYVLFVQIDNRTFAERLIVAR